jgi:MSHA biogenesis protein MshP
LGRKRGFSLISAIFLLVVLSALGAAIVNVTTAQHAGSALDVQGARAYQAARAGVEWGLYQKVNGSCAASSSFAMPATSALSQFSVTVACVKTASVTPGLDRYQVIAIACNQPSAGGACPNPSASPNYVERVVQVEF